MSTDDLYGLLEDYLDGNLSAAERTNLEARLAADPALASEMKLLRELRQRTANLAPAQAFERRLEEKLRRAGQVHFEKKTATPVVRLFARPRARLAIAASVALLICLAGWLFFFNNPLNDKQLAARFFEPPAALGVFRSEEAQAAVNEQIALRQQVDSLYQAKKYAPALSLMNRLEASFQEQPSSDYYFQRGILYLLDGQPRLALADFSQVRNGHENDKKWYAAWATLQAGRREEALILFEKIARSDSPWRRQAAAVLKAMT